METDITLSRRKVIIIIVAALALGFGGGILIARSHGTGDSLVSQQIINQEAGKPQDIDFSLFWKVWDTLQRKYVNKDSLNYQKMVYGAVQGMVNSLGDPYTVFFEPETSKKFQEEISGSFGGIGIEIGKKNNVLTVIAPLKDTPAARAGLQAGDKILKIDGKATDSLAVEEAVSMIRGRKGTKVTLTVANSKNELKDVTMTREVIKVPTVTWKMIDDRGKPIAYLQLFSFNQTIDSEFAKAAQEILKSNAQGLIVDVRNNPGGLLDSAIDLSGWFLEPNQLVVSEVFANGTKNDFRSDGNGSLRVIPTLLISNGGSASASEILAGALHDNRRIKIIGEKTFGKGSVQELETFDKGASLKVTVAKWLTPAGVSISEKGIEPDIKVAIPDKDRDSGAFELGAPGKDPQLDKALDLIR